MSAEDRMSELDYAQVIKRFGWFVDGGAGPNPPEGGIPVINVGGTLVPERYDNIELTYVASGDGVGEIETVTYYLAAAQVAMLTLSYDGSNRLISVVRS